MSDGGNSLQRCPAPRQDGLPCRGRPGPSGFCVGHAPEAAEWRRKGGRNTSRLSRACRQLRYLPAGLWPVARILRQVFGEREAAVLIWAVVEVTKAGDLEERPARQRKSSDASPLPPPARVQAPTPA